MFKRDKICIIVGLDSELKSISNLDVNANIGYGNIDSSLIAKKNLKNTDCFISFGFAGSVDTNLKNGQIIIPKNIIWSDKTSNEVSLNYRNYIVKKLNSFEISSLNLTSVKSIINSKKLKNQIKNKLKVSAIDMESEAIHQIAKSNNKFFVSIRVILDDLSFPIPDFITKNSFKGKVNYQGLFISLIKRPRNLFDFIKLILYYQNAIKKLKEISKKIF